MKNSEIHIGLEKKELRDFIASNLRICAELQCTLKKSQVEYDGKDIIGWSIRDSKSEIEYHQKKIINLQNQSALIGILNILGWEEFDVSDDTIKDSDNLFYMNFAGTQKEYDNFIKNLNHKK